MQTKKNSTKVLLENNTQQGNLRQRGRYLDSQQQRRCLQSGEPKQKGKGAKGPVHGGWHRRYVPIRGSSCQKGGVQSRFFVLPREEAYPWLSRSWNKWSPPDPGKSMSAVRRWSPWASKGTSSGSEPGVSWTGHVLGHLTARYVQVQQRIQGRLCCSERCTCCSSRSSYCTAAA